MGDRRAKAREPGSQKALRHLTASLKAVVGFFVPALTLIATKLEGGVSGRELGLAGISGVLTSIIVWLTPNQEV